MKKRLLFVDDEPNILSGLQRMLRPMRKEWDMFFANSGAEALEMMEKESVDVIVSDMRMPGMDGAQLLNKIMELYPETIRFVLSGQSDRETIFRSLGPTHQFICKPCDADNLKTLVARAFALRDVLKNEELKRNISQIEALPTLPDSYLKLMEELQTPDPSIQTIGKILEQDVAMCAKVLQLVNSAFFGLRQHVASPSQAASLLGVDIIRSLVLVVNVFQTKVHFDSEFFSIEHLQHHSMLVGVYARAIAKIEQTEKTAMDDAFIAAVLHDVGKLVMSTKLKSQYLNVLKLVEKKGYALIEAEKDVFSCTHAEVGAYLLGLWGFPDPIIEATAFHHNPVATNCDTFNSLTAVHIANYLASQSSDTSKCMHSAKLDMPYLERLNLQDRVDNWKEICDKIGNT